jgi:hypothetical protein
MPNCPRREPYFCKPSHQITDCTKLGDFLVLVVHLINKHHCKRNGVTWPSGWSDVDFQPFTFKIISISGAKNGQNPPNQLFFFPRLLFNTLEMS